MVLPPPAHDSGAGWFATPFLCGSFIRSSMPVCPGAFPDTVVLLRALLAADGAATDGTTQEKQRAPVLLREALERDGGWLAIAPPPPATPF